jgi:hypothetical protein
MSLVKPHHSGGDWRDDREELGQRRKWTVSGTFESVHVSLNSKTMYEESTSAFEFHQETYRKT